MSQLRGHWEETSGKVMNRRNQLEDLLADNRGFEAKRREAEAWLSRMEAWQGRMRPPCSGEADGEAIEAQIREQKVNKRCIRGHPGT